MINSATTTSNSSLIYPPYRSTLERGVLQPLVLLELDEQERTTPTFSRSTLRDNDADLTKQSSGEPIGERIVVAGRVIDEDGEPVRNSLIEVWQCNAAGRYHHWRDQHDAPLDPHFHGLGKMLTDDEGNYRFVSIKPGPYPWRNHANAWRPAHIHFSLFGNVYAQRLITQMYVPGDPLIPLDPIYNSAPEGAREALISCFDLDLTVEGIALGYRFDIVLRGRGATPFGL
ncbi:MAG TPA: protocatechuate 3,4-dioxygenase subunit beta [Burkholderiales bacterium]|nr:protocatechuate 3,4-dioxygenase subunit beta [Burkholderiales bacterium]